MKKQFFLLSLVFASINAGMLVADSCGTSCATSCSTNCGSSADCDNGACAPEHGHTFMSIAPEFGAASPERVSLFESSKLKNLKHNEKHGALQVVLYGGQNTRRNRAAGYYLPYGHTKLTFDGSTKPATFASVLAESDVLVVGATTAQVMPTTATGTGTEGTELAVGGNYDVGGNTVLAVDPATFKFDTNKDTSIVLPWNFGITYAALYEPRGAAADGSLVGTGLVTAPTFQSTINPCLRRWHIGAGLEFAYHFSDEVDGWFGKISTAVQHVRSRIHLNETVVSEKELLDDSLPAANPTGSAITNQIAAFEFGGTVANPAAPIAAGDPYQSQLLGVNGSLYNIDPAGATPYGVATTTPVGSIRAAYLGYNGTVDRSTGFPTDLAGDEAVVAPANVSQAFNQASWKYGKIGCDNRITRLADIELSIGRLWTCGDCASTSWDFGIVIPTGNKPCAEFVAPAVVGNNQHFAIRTGSNTSILLSENDDSSCGISSTWFRMDTDARYLFRNTQKRSFDLKGNEWSRYMMVWANKDAYSSAISALVAPLTATPSDIALPQRGYTPGINVFTTDFHVKPKFQGRLNSALVLCGERFKAELGWNVHARTKECVELACGWDSAPAFADSSYVGGVGLNNNRTIYNDSQTTVVNGVDSLARGFTMANEPLVAIPGVPASAGTTVYRNPSTQEANLAAAVAQYDNFAITEADIELNSVASAGSISNTPYLTLGYAFDCDWMPVLGVGASYEFTATNSGLNQWMVWGKFECAF